MIKDLLQEVISELQIKAEQDQRPGYKEAINDLLCLYEAKISDYEKNVKKRNGDIIDQFLADKKLAGCSLETIKNYRIELTKFKNEVNKSIEEINDSDIKAYLTGFESLKKSTIATKTSILRSFFTYLVDEEIISNNPMRKIKRIKEEKKQPKYLSMEELLRLREAAGQDLRLRAILEFLFETGCRISEMVNIDINQIDWNNRSIIVKGKGAKERTVFFHTGTFYYLKKYLDSRLDSSPALFVTKIGGAKRIHPRTVQMELNKLGKKAYINKRIHPHMLRHTFATHLLNKGMDIATVGELLGHEKLSTTQHYARVTEQRKKEEYSRFIA